MTGGAASRGTPSMIPVVAPVHWRADAQGYGTPDITKEASGKQLGTKEMGERIVSELELLLKA